MQRNKQTKAQRLARFVSLSTGLAWSEFNQETRHMSRGFSFGSSAPGDGKCRWELELYDGSGSGINKVLFFSLGWGAFEEKVRAFVEGWQYGKGEFTF